MSTNTIPDLYYKKNTYDVTLSSDGDHIVLKHNKKDSTVSYLVEPKTETWYELVIRALHQLLAFKADAYK